MIRTLRTLFVGLLLLAAPLAAGLVDAVSIVVNDRPITLYEIYKTEKSLGLPKTKAIEFLIKKRIREEELARLGIHVDDFDVNSEIERIARQNGIDSLKMRTILAKQGVDWEAYKKRIREKLLQERLYRQILSTKIQSPSDETLKEYYRLHIDAFSLPEKIRVIQYSSAEKRALLKAMENPLATVPGVIRKQETLETEGLNPELLFLLTKTPKGEFTEIVPVGRQYVAFLVQDFVNPRPLPFEKVKQKVFAQWMEQKQKEAIESHFEKLRAAATVKIVRTP
ncbi:peptidylprolyl isomerase [Hydrogenimonas sp.]